MKIFITGGTGNIGQYVTKALLDAGHQLVIYTRSPERIPALAQLENAEVLKGDMLDLGLMKQGLQGCDAIVHIALGWGNDAFEMLNNDTRVTAFLLTEGELAGVKNFIYTSSTAVMGIAAGDVDERTPLCPNNLYSATKTASEAFVLGFTTASAGQGKPGGRVKMRRNVIRPGYIFSNPLWEGGASQSDVRFRDIARKALQGEDIAVAGGTQFLAASQIAQVYLKLAESGLNGEIFFALAEKIVFWEQIAQWAVDCVPGSKSKVVVSDFGAKTEYYRVEKIKRTFGLCFDAEAELKGHVRWNVEREAKVLAGEKVHDVYHVWQDYKLREN